VRILHVRPDHVGGRVTQGTLRSRRRISEGTDERQHLPLWSLCQYRGRNSTSSKEQLINHEGREEHEGKMDFAKKRKEEISS
jgi:hypothetical protein